MPRSIRLRKSTEIPTDSENFNYAKVISKVNFFLAPDDCLHNGAQQVFQVFRFRRQRMCGPAGDAVATR
jgi:hypothetical protein